MTLDELYSALPNGFHDSVVHSIKTDYSRREVRLDISVWIGDVEDEDEGARERYRDGELLFSGVAFYIIEPPDLTYPYYGETGITIDTGEVRSLNRPPTLTLPPAPEGVFVNWIYVYEWNSNIYVAARDARLRWYDEKKGDKTNCGQA